MTARQCDGGVAAPVPRSTAQGLERWNGPGKGVPRSAAQGLEHWNGPGAVCSPDGAQRNPGTGLGYEHGYCAFHGTAQRSISWNNTEVIRPRMPMVTMPTNITSTCRSSHEFQMR
jgi:hypothetical protein